MSPTSAVERAIGQTLGRHVQILARTTLAGGSISHTECIETTGGSYVVKSHPHAPPGLFRAESIGLTALRESGTTLTIPRVIAHEDAEPSLMVLEYLAPARRRSDFDERLGQGLAALHRATAERFGFHADNYCGSTAQVNTWRERWVEFYGEMRLGYQLGLASESALLTTGDASRIARVITRLGSWVGEPAEGPALIHGDLWSGNLHTDSNGHPALIDPAAYYGHREAELGMMTLFGGFSTRVFEAYDEAFPLDPGWRERNPLYQLYHLMNHLHLFGRAYHAQVMSVANRFA